MNKVFKKEMKSAKSQFYQKNIAELKLAKPGQWYSCLKIITSHDQHKTEETIVEQISHLSDQEQAESIADRFCSIQNEYEPIKKDDICIPPYVESEIPQFHPSQVWFVLSRVDTNKSTVTGDFPAKLIKQFAAYLAEPLTDIYNASMKRGEYPNIFKSKPAHLFQNVTRPRM